MAFIRVEKAWYRNRAETGNHFLPCHQSAGRRLRKENEFKMKHLVYFYYLTCLLFCRFRGLNPLIPGSLCLIRLIEKNTVLWTRWVYLLYISFVFSILLQDTLTPSWESEIMKLLLLHLQCPIFSFIFFFLLALWFSATVSLPSDYGIVWNFKIEKWNQMTLLYSVSVVFCVIDMIWWLLRLLIASLQMSVTHVDPLYACCTSFH